ncbi:MAG: HD domain-containing protein [Dehalococcoidia bacterium]
MRQRIRQFVEAGRAPSDKDLAFAQEYLGPDLYSLFITQHPRDVVHGAATARWLMERGYDDRALITAGFLHDIGKGPQRRTDRALYVVLARVGTVQWAADGSSRFELRRAMERTRVHSERGASLLMEAGAEARVAELTALHHGPPGSDRMLALLQEADAAS